MKTRYEALGILFFSLSTFFIHTISDCVLNYTSLPYQPNGDCLGANKYIKAWDSFSTTLCCRNALSSFSQALALNSRIGDQNIFLSQNQWTSCGTSFSQTQSIITFDSCGFNDLYDGYSTCSSTSLSSMDNLSYNKGNPSYKDALNKCADFNSSFDKACGDCVQAVLTLRDTLLVDDDKHDGAICVAAAVIAVAARRTDDPTSVNDFYSCLHASDILDVPGNYIRFKASLVKAVLAFFLAIFFLIVAITLIKFVTKNSKNGIKPVQKKHITTWSGLYRFSKAEIENAINFCNDQKISLGRGSAGQVFKGVLPSGQVVAIKKIYKTNMSDSFNREVDGLSRIRHPNLVCLFGCCIEAGEQYLVYEYCSNGNLAQHLLKRDAVLPWDRRVKILRDCALALKFLHHHVDGCIVHRDFKLTNILLTDEMDAKLSDFGIVRMLKMDESKVFTDVKGTIGYMDPEYMINAKLTCASDIYSFGIVALQLLSGQKVIDLDLDARDQLTRKAKDVSLGKRPLSDFIDPRLNGNLNLVDFESILQVAVLCVAKSSNGRPKINVVFEEMDKAFRNTPTYIQHQDQDQKEKEMSSSANSQSVSLDV